MARFSAEMLGALALALALLGAWIQWRLSWLVSDVEEATKDAKLTAEAMGRRLKVLRWLGPALIVAGLVLLAIAVLSLERP